MKYNVIVKGETYNSEPLSKSEADDLLYKAEMQEDTSDLYIEKAE